MEKLEAQAKKRFMEDKKWIEEMKEDKGLHAWKGLHSFIPGMKEKDEVERILKLHGWHMARIQRGVSARTRERNQRI